MFIDSRGCHSKSESVQYAKSLSRDQLAALYSFMGRAAVENGKFDRVSPMGDDDVPVELKGFEFRRVDLGDGYMVVEGCFDNYVTMRFHGIGRFKNFPGREIILNYGEEFEGGFSDVLWSDEP